MEALGSCVHLARRKGLGDAEVNQHDLKLRDRVLHCAGWCGISGPGERAEGPEEKPQRKDRGGHGRPEQPAAARTAGGRHGQAERGGGGLELALAQDGAFLSSMFSGLTSQCAMPFCVGGAQRSACSCQAISLQLQLGWPVWIAVVSH